MIYQTLDFSSRPHVFEIIGKIDSSPLVRELSNSQAQCINLGNCYVNDLYLSRVRKCMQQLKEVRLDNADLDISGIQFCKLLAKEITLSASPDNRSLIQNKIREFVTNCIFHPAISESDRNKIINYGSDFNRWQPEAYQKILEIHKEKIEPYNKAERARALELQKVERLAKIRAEQEAATKLLSDWTSGANGFNTKEQWIDGPKTEADWQRLNPDANDRKTMMVTYALITHLDMWEAVKRSSFDDQLIFKMWDHDASQSLELSGAAACLVFSCMKKIALSGGWTAYLNQL